MPDDLSISELDELVSRCQQFEDSWSNDEGYLTHFFTSRSIRPKLRQRLFLQLVEVDVELRLRRVQHDGGKLPNVTLPIIRRSQFSLAPEEVRQLLVKEFLARQSFGPPVGVRDYAATLGEWTNITPRLYAALFELAPCDVEIFFDGDLRFTTPLDTVIEFGRQRTEDLPPYRRKENRVAVAPAALVLVSRRALSLAPNSVDSFVVKNLGMEAEVIVNGVPLPREAELEPQFSSLVRMLDFGFRVLPSSNQTE